MESLTTSVRVLCVIAYLGTGFNFALSSEIEHKIHPKLNPVRTPFWLRFGFVFLWPVWLLDIFLGFFMKHNFKPTISLLKLWAFFISKFLFLCYIY